MSDFDICPCLCRNHPPPGAAWSASSPWALAGRLGIRVAVVPAPNDDTGLLLAPTQDLAPEAFLNHPDVALPMARFPEAERRRLHKMICMQCYARNAMRATRCRKCGSRELRPKAKEARKE